MTTNLNNCLDDVVEVELEKEKQCPNVLFNKSNVSPDGFVLDCKVVDVRAIEIAYKWYLQVEEFQRYVKGPNNATRIYVSESRRTEMLT